MAGEVCLAGLCRLRLLTARELRIKALDSLEKRLRFCHCSRVVLRGFDTARVRLPAQLTLLSCANILGPAVSLSEPPTNGL